jgi:hypothetical protein
MPQDLVTRTPRPLSVRLASVAVWLLPLAAGCGGGRMLEPRYVAVHNAMTAMGLSQSGSISEGSLPEGGESLITSMMTPGTCYTILALGSGGVADIDVLVRDASGTEVAHDVTTDGQAAAQFCPSYGGEFTLAVRMTRGSGGYVVSSWSGGTSGASTGYYDPYSGAYTDPSLTTAAVEPHGGPGSCEAPYELAALTAVRGNTTGADAQMTGSCITGGNAPEHIYWFELAERSVVTAVLNSSYDGALYLLSECGDTRSEFACNDDAPTTSRSEVRANLEAGLYYVVVDGYGAGAGDYEVSLEVAPMRSEAEICDAANVLPIGTPVAGSTATSADYFAATCSGGSPGPDQVYALDIASRSRLRVRMQSVHDGALHIRTACTDASTEVACNDEYGTGHNLINMTVDPGRYYVFADGGTASSLGDYSLLAETAPVSGGPAVAGESCGSAAPWDPATGTVLPADTFAATDDLAGSCGGSGSPDTVYRLDLRSRTRIRASFADAEFPPVAYIRRTCADTTTEVVCMNPMAAGGTVSVDQTLPAGTYYFVVDGAGGPDAFGAANMNLQLDDLGALEAACRGAPLVRPGTQITGSTATETDHFQATCAGGAMSPDRVYRLVLRRRSTVRISSEQTEWDGAIYLRSDCTDATTELGCNDDAGDNRHSMIETELEAGTYYLFMDGFSTSSSGDFTLDVEVTASR